MSIDDLIWQYADEVRKNVPKKIGNWSLYLDGTTGIWEWYSKNHDIVVSATFMWDGQIALPVNVSNAQTGAALYQTSIPLNPTMDCRKDAKIYTTSMKKLLPMIEKKYVNR